MSQFPGAPEEVVPPCLCTSFKVSVLLKVHRLRLSKYIHEREQLHSKDRIWTMMCEVWGVNRSKV